MSVHSTDPALARVQVGIDAAVVAEDHVTIRSSGRSCGASLLLNRLCSMRLTAVVEERGSVKEATW